MLKKLTLKNWKSHKDTEIDFSKGYNVFVGNIGTGKTSIFDAIVFALFGTTPNVSSRKVAVKDLIMSKPVENEDASITLELDLEEELYKIERLLFKNKTSQAKIYKNNLLIRGPKPSDVNEEIEKIFGITFDTFMKSNYAEQNSIDFFLKLPSNERKQLFDNLFDISFYDDIHVNSRQINNKLKIKIEESITRQKEYKTLLENYDLKDIKNKFDSLLKEIENLNNEIKEYELKLKKKREDESLILKLKNEYENSNNTANNLIGKEKYLENEIKQLNEFSIRKKEEIEKELEELKKEKETINKEKIKSEQENNNLKSRNMYLLNKIKENETKKIEINKIKDELDKIPLEINNIVNNLVKEIEEKRNIITKSETNIQSINKEIENLENIHAKCPLCTQELPDEKKDSIITEKKEAIQKENESLNKTKEIYLSFKKEYEDKNKQREFYNRNIDYYNKIKNESLDIEKYNKELIENKTKEQQQKDILENILNKNQINDKKLKDLEEELRKTKDLENKQIELNKIKKEINELQIKIKESKYNPEEFLKIKEELQKLISENSFKKEIILEKEKQKKEQEFKIEQYNKIQNNYKRAEKEFEIITKYINDFSIISNVSKKTQEQVRQQIVENINLIFQDLWQHIYPYKDFQNIQFNITDGDYKIELFFNNEYKRELDEYISGGERSSIALALRIAMCLVMRNKLNLIVLDEPTHNLDKKTVLKLSELFNNYLPQFIEQTFVITHDTSLEQYANSIYRIQRDKETDGATEIN